MTILALDFGGTKLMAGVVDVVDMTTAVPQWLAHGQESAVASASYETDMAQMMSVAQRLLNGRSPSAVGISFGGPVHYAKGLVRLSHHVPGWENIPLAQQIADAFNLPVTQVAVDNDANVAALGEWRLGAGRGCRSLIYVTISTGVGSGFILDERPYRGHSSMAGELGHMVVDPGGPRCLCGKRGCVERLASGPYMAEDLARALGQPIGSLTGRDVALMAGAGDPVAQRILEGSARALGVGIGNAANLLDIQRFVLGGGVTKSGDHWWQVVRSVARQTALPEIELDIVPADLGDDAPLWGAAVLAASL